MKIKIKYVGIIETEIEVPDELNPNLVEETYSLTEYIAENDLLPIGNYCDIITLGTIVEYQIDEKTYEL